MGTKISLFVSAFCLLTFSGIADASGPARISQKFKEYTAEANKKIETVVDTYNFPLNGITEIAWNIGPNGEVRDPQVASSSGNSVADMACLEAVLSSSPENKKYAGTNRNFRFSSRMNSKPSGKKQFLERNPTVSRDTALVYVIPLSVDYRYPGLFKQAELLSADNVRILGAPNSDKKLIQFLNAWSSFFEKNPTATKESIRAQAKLLSSSLLGKN